LIFLGEYSMILFIRILFVIFFLGANFSSWLFFFKLVCVRFLFIWVRGSLPRYRYDKLINLCWKRFLGFVILNLIYLVNFLCLIYIFIL
jgi:NADH-ubiquinone oxidoreductase chain 1